MKRQMKEKINKSFFSKLIAISLIINVTLSLYNINKFDNIKQNYNDKYFNQLLYADLGPTWIIADKFKKRLDNGDSFFNALPAYERFLLPSIIVGLYYHIINEEITETRENKQIVIKEDNYKIYLLLLQILFFYLSIILLSKEVFKKFSEFKSKIIILLLCLEPSLLQWHSSFWSESIFISFMIIVFYLLLKNSKKFFPNLLVGLLVGLMFAQRSVSFLYILPIILFYIFTFKIELKPIFFLLLGYLSIISLVGYNNYKKTDTFFLIPTTMTYYGYYHYFAADIFANRNKISISDAQEVLDKNEKNWLIDNKINLENTKDKVKTINFRNKFFLEEIIKNPVYTFKLYLRRVIKTSVLMPFWVNNHYYFDRTNPEAISDPKKYYNKNFLYNLPYTIIFHAFSLTGILLILRKIFLKKKYDFISKFYIFNLLSISYFLFISGFWGNPKYFTPCIISLYFFFTEGLTIVLKKYSKFIKQQ